MSVPQLPEEPDLKMAQGVKRHRLFNARKFGRTVRGELAAKGLSVRRAAREIGISSATVSRVARGRPPDVESYLRLRLWLGWDARAYADGAP